MIDICDFAVRLSRQLWKRVLQSERPDHRMFEQWHPLGVVGVITAFNFRRVWSWNAALAAVCGDSTLWKPSSQVPLCGVAATKLAAEVCRENGIDPGYSLVLIGKGSTVGERILQDKRIPLISFTGSTEMGFRVAETVGKRLGRTILETRREQRDHRHAEHGAAAAILFGACGTARSA